MSDLARGHLLTLESYKKLDRFQVLNLGTGSGTSVKKLVEGFEKSTKLKVKTQVISRREGDVARSFADTKLASELIGFKCDKSIDDMCADTWNWQIKNPEGYASKLD